MSTWHISFSTGESTSVNAANLLTEGRTWTFLDRNNLPVLALRAGNVVYCKRVD